MISGAVQAVFARTLHENRGITLAIWVNLALLAGAVLVMPFDHRRILGLNPWVKPIKFDLSVLIYAITIALFLSLLEGSVRARWMIGWGIGIAMMVENCIISLQSARGVPSHMNYSSLFNGAAFGVMGLLIALNTLLVTWLLVLYLTKQHTLPIVVTWGIRLGLFTLLAGSIEGVLMVGTYGAHTIGAPDGGPGFPFVNWSTGHGDLRVAHFFAIHALQMFPSMGWALSRTRLRLGTQCATLATAVLLYLAGVWILFAQAKAGRPVLGATQSEHTLPQPKT